MKNFSKLILFPLLALVAYIATSCEDVNVDTEGMPYAISDCDDQYFQGRGISSYRELDNGNYMFTINDGPTLVIDIISNEAYNVQFTLISYQGDGETMPTNLAYDQIPLPLYNYIDGLESINQIYWMTRTNKLIFVGLLDTDIRYDTVTETIEES